MRYMPNDPPDQLVFDTTDRYGKRIFLEQERYDIHITGPIGHVELLGHELAIQDTIENPDIILQSVKLPSRWLYIAKSTKAKYKNTPIKTVVDHVNTSYGFVVTSLFQRDIDPMKEGAKIIYEKSTDPNKS